MIATNTITSTSVLDVDTAAPNATPSAAKQQITVLLLINNYVTPLKKYR